MRTLLLPAAWPWAKDSASPVRSLQENKKENETALTVPWGTARENALLTYLTPQNKSTPQISEC